MGGRSFWRHFFLVANTALMDNLIIWFGTSTRRTIAFILIIVTRNLLFFLHFLKLCGTTTDLNYIHSH